jgi:sugar-phosphatase
MAALTAGEPPAGVLLDLDGTLLDSEPVHRAAYEAFFAARGWTVPPRTYAHFVGRRGTDVFRTLPGPWTGLDPDDLVAEVFAHADAVDVTPVEARGAARLVRSLHAAGIPLALVTSAQRDWAERALTDILDVRGCFTHIVSWEDVPAGKPHPAPFLRGCELLGVAPGDAVAVEDSVAGVESAVAAGIGRVVAVTSTTDPGLLVDAGAHAVVAHLEELVPAQ